MSTETIAIANDRSLQEQWPDFIEQHPENADGIHLSLLWVAAQITNQTIVGYKDDRLVLALYNLSAGSGQKASVMMEAESGTGKTKLGDTWLGEETRTEANSDDTVSSLYGFESAFRDGVMPGSVKNYNSIFRALFLNEGAIYAGQPSPITMLFDRKQLQYNGATEELEGASILVTGNFPNGRRVKISDDAYISRMAMKIAMGDLDDEGVRARDIVMGRRENQIGPNKQDRLSPIIPNYEIRKQIGEMVTRLHPISDDAATLRMRLFQSLNETGLINELQESDGRKNAALYAAAKSNALLADVRAYHNHDRVKPSPIGPLEIANVSDLAVNAITILTSDAIAAMSEIKGSRLTNTDIQLAAQRLIAREAIKVYFNHFAPKTPRNQDELAKLLDGKSEERLGMVNNATHVNIKAAKFDVDVALNYAMHEAKTLRKAAQKGVQEKLAALNGSAHLV